MLKRFKNSNRFRLMSAGSLLKAALLSLIILSVISASPVLSLETEVRLGVLANKGVENALKRWNPTAAYLNQQLPGYSFKIIPLRFEEVEPAVKNENIDFILTNTSHYIELESLYGVNRILTLMDSGLTVFGGTIFCLADRNDIHSLQDLKGKTFMAVDEFSLGGWRAAWRELKEQGVDPLKKFESLEFGGSHNDVVTAVIARKVDAGTARTGTLEKLAKEGKIKLDSLRILNEKKYAGFPFRISTRLYPEWPLAKLKHTSDDLSKKVSIALLHMPENSKAAQAAEISGWTIPLDYYPVHELMKELRVRPYEDFGKITLLSIVNQYWYMIIMIIIVLLSMSFFLLYIGRTNRKLQKLSLLIKHSSELVSLSTLDGKMIFLNEAGQKLLGIDPEAIEQINILQVIPDHLFDLVQSKILPELISGREWEGDLQYRNLKTDILTDVHAITFTIKDPKTGKPQYIANISLDISERKRAEETLYRSEERFRALTENTSDWVWEVDQAFVFTYVSPKVKDILGYDPKEVIGKTPFDFMPEDEAKRISATAHSILESHKSFTSLENINLDKNGRQVILETNAIPIFDKNGNFAGYRGIDRDITERKRADMELLREKQFTEKLLESLPGIFFLYDSTCHLKRWNKAHETAMGFTADELRDWYIPDWHETPEDAAVGMALVKSVLDTGVGGEFETTLINREGRFVPYLISITRLMTPDGPVMMGVGIDITERKKAEEALRISEEKYRLVVENASDAIFIVQDGTIKFPNRTTLFLTGYSEEELTSVPFLSCIYDDDKKMVNEMHRKQLQGQEVPAIYSFRIIKKSGEMAWVEANAVLVTWENSPAALSFLRDITVQKKLEEQLLHAQKMEAIGTLAGGVAHDFNNLLMGIIGYTSLMLMKTDKSHPFYEKLKIIEQLVESGSELTRQLLGFARGGKYEVKPVNINDLIIKTSDIFSRTKKEIIIHKKLQEDLPIIEADPGQIEQVLFNLYVNAWQAMPSGGRLYLVTQKIILDKQQFRTYNLEHGPYIKISVTDTGVGMDLETQKRIFEPFFTTKGVGKGTGLGLASAYGIIKNHGGIINVYSEKGHGTTFTIYLPASGAKTAVAKPSEDGLLTGHETILIVDDERANTESVKELLEILGYKVMVANSGEEAIRLYREHTGKIQLVILDMIMPEMNGKETLIKLMEMDKNVSVLLSSGYSMDGEAKSILDLGCRGFIQKPFRVEELSQKIREVLDR